MLLIIIFQILKLVVWRFCGQIIPNDITCAPNQSENFGLSSVSDPEPEIIFFNPGVYQLSCTIIKLL